MVRDIIEVGNSCDAITRFAYAGQAFVDHISTSLADGNPSGPMVTKRRPAGTVAS